MAFAVHGEQSRRRHEDKNLGITKSTKPSKKRIDYIESVIGHVFDIGFEVESLFFSSTAGRHTESSRRHWSCRRCQCEIILRTRARKAVRWRHCGWVLVQVIMYPSGGWTSSMTQVLTAEFFRTSRPWMTTRCHPADDGVDRFTITLQILSVRDHGWIFANFI